MGYEENFYILFIFYEGMCGIEKYIFNMSFNIKIMWRLWECKNFIYGMLLLIFILKIYIFKYMVKILVKGERRICF